LQIRENDGKVKGKRKESRGKNRKWWKGKKKRENDIAVREKEESRTERDNKWWEGKGEIS
jgi:hypothetical protein